ncbi:MAG: thermonuclease family protein, partial [Chloroflexota bacterium]
MRASAWSRFGSNRRLVWGLVALVLIAGVAPLALSQPRPVEAQRVPPGGAPPAGSGDIEVDGFVRVIDGDTIETYINGQRTGIGLIGVDASQGNTPCGRQATAQLWGLVGGGVRLEEDPSITFDTFQRRMYHVATRDGRALADEQIKAGL